MNNRLLSHREVLELESPTYSKVLDEQTYRASDLWLPLDRDHTSTPLDDPLCPLFWTVIANEVSPTWLLDPARCSMDYP